MTHLLTVVREETFSFHLRVFLIKATTFFLPNYVGNRWRTFMFRLVGFQIGIGTSLGGMPTLTGGKQLHKNLIIGERAWLNFGCVFDLEDQITIGDSVDIGHEVLFMTTTHEIGNQSRRAAKRITKPIVIENGVWLGARCTILPGITIGEGSIVAAGAVVTKDVAPNTIVGGVPATVLRQFPTEQAHQLTYP